jgi:hypothetical protein
VIFEQLGAGDLSTGAYISVHNMVNIQYYNNIAGDLLSIIFPNKYSLGALDD